jgi:hypothetical protein
MPTSASPGGPSSAIRSPTTNTSGCPGSEQSGCTSTRPERSTAAFVRSARSGRAVSPARPPPRSSRDLRCDRLRRRGRLRRRRRRACRGAPRPRASRGLAARAGTGARGSSEAPCRARPEG